MAPDPMAPRSRRALLTAAAGAAGALAAQATLPLTAAAAPANMMTEQDNPTTATTSVTNSGTDTAFGCYATGTGSGYGAEATSLNGGGLVAWSVAAPDAGWFTPDLVKYTGVFGSAPSSTDENYAGTGVWGDSPDMGVVGTGGTGVLGWGYYGVEGWTNDYAGSIGVRAVAATTSQIALRAEGKVSFSRSGRKSMSSGKSSLVISLAGVTSSSKVFAVLATSESGRWVRAVYPQSGKFTVYLNTALSSSAVVAWFVLD